jgi:hypothetical protein
MTEKKLPGSLLLNCQISLNNNLKIKKKKKKKTKNGPACFEVEGDSFQPTWD